MRRPVAALLVLTPAAFLGRLDVAAMNRESVSAAVPGYGVDAPTPDLVAVATAMVGQWSGTRTTPWDGTHPVLLTFFANGRYSMAHVDGSMPFYHGEHCGYHRSYWRVDTGSRSLAEGELQINFNVVNTCTVEWIKHIQVDATSLQFDHWHFQAYGPIHFDLRQITPAH